MTQDDAGSAPMLGSVANYPAKPDGWIPVTERLPERNERVLVVDESGVNVGSYSPMLDDWWSIHGDRMAPGPTVTHWMPLPAPPETSK